MEYLNVQLFGLSMYPKYINIEQFYGSFGKFANKKEFEDRFDRNKNNKWFTKDALIHRFRYNFAL